METLTRQACSVHHTQFVTNFCEEETCMVALCPSCIPIHLQSHPKTLSNPRIENINSTISKSFQTLTTLQSQLQHQKQQLKDISHHRESLKYRVKQCMYTTKLEIKELLDGLFKQLEEDFLERIQQSQLDLDMREERLAQLQMEIDERILGIACSLNSLRTNFEVESLAKTMKPEYRQVIASHIYRTDQEIKINKQFQVNVVVNGHQMEMLKRAVAQVIEVDIKPPQQSKTRPLSSVITQPVGDKQGVRREIQSTMPTVSQTCLIENIQVPYLCNPNYPSNTAYSLKQGPSYQATTGVYCNSPYMQNINSTHPNSSVRQQFKPDVRKALYSHQTVPKVERNYVNTQAKLNSRYL